MDEVRKPSISENFSSGTLSYFSLFLFLSSSGFEGLNYVQKQLIF
jgi:hypothetical protein